MLVAEGAGGGGDDRDKDKRIRVTKNELVKLLQEIVIKLREEEDSSELEASLKELYQQASDGVKDDFKKRYEGTFFKHNIDVPWG